jgi:hypothetical protein
MTITGYKSKMSGRRYCCRWRGWLAAAGLVLVCILPAWAIEQARPYAISSRIGSEIDSEERDYFGLFPGFEGFTIARTRKSAGGDVVIYLLREGSDRDSTIIINAHVEPVLRAYIEDFESILRGDAAARWDLLFDLADQPDISLRQHGKRAKVIVGDGGEISGELLFASNDVLLLWQGDKPFAWDDKGAGIKPVAPRDIEHIAVSTGTSFWASLGGGAGGGFLLSLIIMSGLDGLDEDSENPENFTFRQYATVTGIATGIGLVGGAVYGAARGSEDEYVVGFQSTNYDMHLTKVRKKCLFREAPPPEFRDYYDPGVRK